MKSIDRLLNFNQRFKWEKSRFLIEKPVLVIWNTVVWETKDRWFEPLAIFIRQTIIKINQSSQKHRL